MNRLLVGALLIAAQAAALDTSNLRPQGYVSDFAGALDAGARNRIEMYLGQVERSTQAQFAVVIVKSLEGEPIEDVAVRLFSQWGIGQEKTDEGLLFLLAIDDRQQRIENGYGIEAYISDGFAGGVMRSIRPILRQGDYGGAILAAVEQLANKVAAEKGVAIEGTQAPPPSPVRSPGGSGIGGLIGFGILMLILFSIFGGGGRGGRGGRGGGNTGALLAGMLLGNMMGHRGGSGGGWSHGGFGGGGGGGWGGGGFGGFGGGSSGGGGASGNW